MNHKKILSVIIAFVMISTICIVSVSAINYTSAADDLKSMGLFIGTDKGYELEREPTRLESAVMLVRLLGKEEEAKQNNYQHPFTHVPEWVNFYVGYLYEKGLTKGVGGNKFGSGLCNTQMFCTFVLRALGYTEDGGDFNYADAIAFALELGLLDENILYNITPPDYMYDWVAEYEDNPEYVEWLRSLYALTREYCVAIMYNALNMKVKGLDMTLIEKLIAESAVKAEAAANFIEKNALIAEFQAIMQSLTNVMITEAMAQRFSIDIEAIDFISGTDYDVDGDIEKMLAELRLILSMLKEEDGYTVDDFIAYLEERDADYSYEDFLAGLEEYESLEAYIAQLESVSAMLEGMISSESLHTSTMNITVAGEDIAIVSTSYGAGYAVYYKDGYIYTETMGQKVKISLEGMSEEEASETAAALIGIDIFDMENMIEDMLKSLTMSMIGSLSAASFGSIDKTETEENIVFIFNAQTEIYDDAFYDTISIVIFTLGVAGVNIFTQGFENGELLYETIINIIFTSGDDITIDFPDFSEYEETMG